MLEFNVRISRNLARFFVIGAVVIIAIAAACWAYDQRPKTDEPLIPPAAAHLPKPVSAADQANPWGHIRVTDIMLDVPDEFVQLPPTNAPPLRWHFPGMSRDDVLAVLQSIQLPPEVFGLYKHSNHWISEEGGVALEPSDAMVLQLTREARSKLYPLLIRSEINQAEMDPIWFDRETFKAQLKDSELRPDSIALLKSLMYTQGNTRVVLFADRQVALRQLPDDRERKLFLQMLGRKPAVRVRLTVNEHSNVEELASYWGVGGRRKDILPLLKAMQRTEDDNETSVIPLMPSFIRDRVWTFPFPSSNPSMVRQDCFWSAFNTFNAVADDRLGDMSHLREVLDRDYYTIMQPSQLGDVILLTTPEQTAIHAAVYVADDIVFTKNGFHYSQPWIFTRMDAMMQTYLARYPGADALVPQYFRRKGL